MNNDTLNQNWHLFYDGMKCVEHACFFYDEENESFVRVMNGETAEGYAQDRYANTYRFSFDEEVLAFDTFIHEGLDVPRRSFFEQAVPAIEKEGSAVIGLVGFQLMKRALDSLDDLRKSGIDVFEGRLSAYESNIPHLFTDKTFHQFRLAMNGWIRAFGKELKEEMGRRRYETCKRSALSHADRWTGKAIEHNR